MLNVMNAVIFQFRFSDGRDKLLLVLGTLFSALAGLAIPLNLLVYGRVATGFIYYTIIQNRYDINETSFTMNLPVI